MLAKVLLTAIIAILGIVNIGSCVYAQNPTIHIKHVNEDAVVEPSESRLLELIPNDFKYYTTRGTRINKKSFNAQIYSFPSVCSSEADSATSTPRYLFILFDDTGNSVLVQLRNENGTLKRVWESPILEGIGVLKAQDLNNDGIDELLVSLILSSHGYGNLFIYMCVNDKLTPLHKGARTGGISEFTGIINLIESDTSCAIQSFHPDEMVERVYEYGKRSHEFRLLTEKSVDK